ncbi:MAG: imidazole glycerol phosphate synthase subunit HisH, partial [Pseudonocardiaceae bacterium]
MIAVLDYGIGNLCSAHKALLHVGADARLTNDPDVVYSADGVVLPGVGAFGRSMQALRNTGLEEPIRHAISSAKPFLGICVGMQMLYEGSDESPATDGLAALAGTVRRLPDGMKRPQMQWNRLNGRPGGSPSPMFSNLVLGAGEGQPDGDW